MKAVDFFCGAGGVTCGFNQAGIEVLAGIDIDSSCKETYEKNNGAKFLNKDVSKYKPEELQKDLKLKKEDDQLIFIGCSPCQYYSSVNNNKVSSKAGRLLLEDFKIFVEYFKPGYIFIENVPGLKRDKRSPLGRFKTFLKKNCYVFDEKVLNAKFFGVAQSRRRYVLIATRVKDEISLPEPDKTSVKTVRDVIGDKKRFSEIPAGLKDETEFKHSSASLSKKNLLRIRRTSIDGGSRLDWANDPDLQLECYKNHNGHTDVYGRMYWDSPAPTLTTRFYSISNGRYGHPEQDRAISLREGATLQSFPLDYVFHESTQTSIARMIGNAVPPLLAKEIAKAFKN